MPNMHRQKGIITDFKPTTFDCEAEVVEGLESLARTELITLFGKQLKLASHDSEDHPGGIHFQFGGSLRDLIRVRMIGAIYTVQPFAVPRPRALLGHEHFQKLLRQIDTIRSLHPSKTFGTFHLDAAGSDSSVMTRLKAELALHTGLISDDEAGDMHIRIRRYSEGWETLVRITPRPLSTRGWRVYNYEGALNATVAHAMARLTRPKPEDTFLNIACGSGSILIERLASMPTTRIIGCDNNPQALIYARANLAAGHITDEVVLLLSDARTLPLADNAVDALSADLPFGQRRGSHKDNIALYPQILEEAARVAKPGARFVVITHEIRLMDAAIQHMRAWQSEEIYKITLRGLHPRIYVLKKV